MESHDTDIYVETSQTSDLICIMILQSKDNSLWVGVKES